MAHITSFVLAFFASFICASSSFSVFMLIGGTGDLAGKYLWDAVFREVYIKRKDRDVRILTSGRSEDQLGNEKLKKIFEKMRCFDEDGVECPDDLQVFKNRVQYVQLENDIQFAKFCKRAFEDAANLTEIVWYLATPPNYYPMVLMSIHSRCRYNNIPLKVALEKPFWRDSSEYSILGRITQGRFSKQELYFVDHYLAKSTVVAIPEFKRLNSNWFDPKNLEKMELVLLERDQVKDTRLSFYDRYGVVRDVMQSHLNEVMLLLLADPTEYDGPGDEDYDPDDEITAKQEVLQRMRPFSRSTWVSGQHMNYRKLTRGKSATPTFASFELKFDAAPESGVTKEKSIVLTAGKYMEAKRAYARMVFKTGTEVIFLLSAPAIFINVEATKIRPPTSWSVVVAASDDLCSKWLPRIYTNKSCVDFSTLTTNESSVANAYRTVLDHFLTGREASFAKMSVLEESWKLWDHILRAFDEIQPKFYETPDEMLGLVFPQTDGAKQEL